MTDQTRASGIGLLNEKPLHASLKQWYARPGDRFEVPVHGFVIDIVRDEGDGCRRDVACEQRALNLGFKFGYDALDVDRLSAGQRDGRGNHNGHTDDSE